MKHLLCPLMMMLALIVGTQTVNAQKFSSMTEEQRNDTLNKLALVPCGHSQQAASLRSAVALAI